VSWSWVFFASRVSSYDGFSLFFRIFVCLTRCYSLDLDFMFMLGKFIR
jgi:hypothetical protein